MIIPGEKTNNSVVKLIEGKERIKGQGVLIDGAEFFFSVSQQKTGHSN